MCSLHTFVKNHEGGEIHPTYKEKSSLSFMDAGGRKQDSRAKKRDRLYL